MFLVNGLEAGPTVTFAPFGFINDHSLTGTSDVPGVTVVGPPDVSGLLGDEILASYTLTNTGTVAGSFNLDAANDSGWTTTIIGGSTIGPLAPGESEQIDVLVTTPGRVPAIIVELRLTATSDTYAPANCGASTIMDVRRTGVGDVGGSGNLVPNQFSLAQNYPNPFNPETLISFNIMEPGHTRLEVFNILGQSVGVLLDEYLPAGPVVTEWNGRDRNGAAMPSGIYFYRLSRDGASATRQMVLLR
jgi:hypothetical protein